MPCRPLVLWVAVAVAEGVHSMAKIPAFGNLQLGGGSATLTNNVVSIAPGVHKLGDGLNAVANFMLQKKREDDQLQYQKALLDLDAFGNDELNNPDKGYRNLKGENALNEAGNFNQRYEDKIKEIRETLHGNSFLDKFDLQTKDMHTAYSRQLMVHESQEQSALALKTMQAGIDLAMTNAQNLYGDQTALMMGFNNLLARVDQFSQEQGMPEELRNAQRDQIAQQYFSSALDGWVAHTEITNGNFASLAAKMKKSYAYNQLTEVNKAKYMLKVDSLIKRQGNGVRDSLSLELANARAMQERGIEAPDIPLSRFNAAYGNRGQQAYNAYQDGQTLARNIGAMQNMPSSELVAFTNEDILKDGGTPSDLTADPSNPNFAQRLEIQSIRAKAAVSLLKQRSKDPIAAAYQAGEIKQLEFTPEALQERVVQAKRISQDYGTPVRVFSNSEANNLSRVIDDAGVDQQAQLLQAFSQAADGDDIAYNAILNDIGLEHPAFATAGAILNSPAGQSIVVDTHTFKADETRDKQTVAKFILKGAEALKPPKKGDPSIRGLTLPHNSLEAFDEEIGSYFTDDPGAKQQAFSAAMSYYVGKSISNGTYSNTRELDNKLLKESVRAVVGEKSAKYNVRMPWGMSESTFNNSVKYQYLEYVKANGWAEGDNSANYSNGLSDPYKLTQRDFESRFQLIPSTQSNGLPDGRYFIKAGNGFLSDNQGNPVIIDTLKGFKEVKEIPE